MSAQTAIELDHPGDVRGPRAGEEIGEQREPRRRRPRPSLWSKPAILALGRGEHQRRRRRRPRTSERKARPHQAGPRIGEAAAPGRARRSSALRMRGEARAGSPAITARRSASLIAPQPAISSTVRPQPTQSAETRVDDADFDARGGDGGLGHGGHLSGRPADEKAAPGGDLRPLLRGARDVAGLAADLRLASAVIAPAPSAAPSAAASAWARPVARGRGRARSRALRRRRRRKLRGSSRPAAAPAPSARAGSSAASGASAPARETAAARTSRGRGPENPCASAAESAAIRIDEREDERHRAEGADAAVAHDGELLLPGRAAAEAVGDVGEPVLVQRAGRGDERRGRKRRGDERGQAEARRRPERDRADEAHDRARERRSPGEAVEVEARLRRRRQRQAGEEPQRVGDVPRPRRRRSAHKIHRNIATAEHADRGEARSRR